VSVDSRGCRWSRKISIRKACRSGVCLNGRVPYALAESSAWQGLRLAAVLSSDCVVSFCRQGKLAADCCVQSSPARSLRSSSTTNQPHTPLLWEPEVVGSTAQVLSRRL
jgi:hypothetical protein